MLPMMRVMRSRLLSAIVALGAALLTIGSGLALADTVAVNGGATYVSPTSEMLNGVATVTNPDSAVDFQYGTTPSFGSTTPLQFVQPGTNTVAATITGLTPGQKYYFRLVVFQGSYNTKINVSDTLTFTAGSTGGPGGGGASSGTGSLATTKLKVTKGSVAIPVKCTGAEGATCAGKVAITARGRLPRHKKAHTYRCGGGAFSATAGNADVVHGKLSKGCRTLLAHARHHKLRGKARLTFTTKQSPLTTSVTLHR
jgi:hypothetical protein